MMSRDLYKSCHLQASTHLAITFVARICSRFNICQKIDGGKYSETM